MNSIDMILLAGIIAATACLIAIPRRTKGILKPLVGGIGLLVVAQLLSEGFYWHYIPAYLLLAVLAVRAIFPNTFNGSIQKRLLQLALIVLALVSVVPWAIFLPVPKLIKPRGQYTVGTRIFRWVDHSRPEHITSDEDDWRNVVVQAWYPAGQDANGPHSSYLDGLGSLPEKIGVLPGFVFDHYDKVDTYGVLNAPISKAQTKWPVILFLTGNGASRAFYTSLATGLSSFGYVVLTIDHPYEVMVTQLADGRIVTPKEVFLEGDPDLLQFMKNRLDLRIEDVRFVIDQIGNPEGSTDDFFSSLDQNRIVATGHSLGGASAAAAMAVDSRIKAAVNIDGTLYGELPEPNGPRPFLLLESKKDDSGTFLRYEKGNQQLFRQFEGGYRYEMVEADHYSFTDAPLLLGLPARFLAGRLLQFGNVPASTHHATVDILNTFFYGALNGRLANMDSVAARHSGIKRKSID